MALKSTYTREIELNGLDAKHYLVIAQDAIQTLGWKVVYTSKSGFIAMIGGGFMTSLHELRIVIHETSVSITCKNADGTLSDFLGKNEKNVNAFTEAFETSKSTITGDELAQKLTELAPVFESEEEDLLTAPPPSAKQNLLSFLSFFIPHKGYFITPIIINLNIIVFTAMVICGVSAFEPTTQDILNWGADFRPYTLNGQAWRLITNVFLHIGIMHLLLNMYALIYIGLLLEPILDKLKFSAAYIFTGLVASLTSIYFHSATVSAGASGAIFGMYGVFLAMLTTNIIDKSVRMQLLSSIGIFVVYNLLYGTKAGVDNAAHIGGLVSGFVIGYLYYPSLSKPKTVWLEFSTTFFIAMVVLIGSAVAYYTIPNDIATYDNKMKDFSIRESMALEVMNTRYTDKTVVLSELKDRGLYYWNENIELINSVDSLDLPDGLKRKDAKLKKYCQLRIESYNLYYKQIDEGTKKYDLTIDSLNHQIQAIINDIKAN